MSYTHINTNVTAQLVQKGTTRLDRIVVGQAGSADWRVTIYDGVDASANSHTLSVNNLNAGGNYEYCVTLTDGLTVTTAGTTPGDITLVFG